MGESQIDWLSATAVLLSGLVIGAMVLYALRMSSRGAKALESAVPVELRDLRARFDALIIQLRELSDAAPKLASDRLIEERAQLEIDAARALRRIDELEGKAGAVAAVPAVAPVGAVDVVAAPMVASPRSSLTGFVWGVGTAAAMAGLLYFVSQSATKREEGGSLTGSVPQGSSPMQQSQMDPAYEALKLRVLQNPEDIGGRLELTNSAILHEDLATAEENSRFVLERQPENIDALGFLGFVLMAKGQMAESEAILKKALGIDPNFTDGWVQLAILYTFSSRDEDAAKAIDEAIKRAPDRAEELRTLLTRMKAHGETAMGGGGSESAPGTSSSGADSVTEPAAVADGVTGIVDIDPAARSRASANGILWVMAREEGTPGGPPLAVVRLPGTVFPIAFQLTGKNAMMSGGTLPAKLRLDVRIDNDGNPATKDPSDPVGSIESVALGSSGVRVMLR